jgi:pimeloyl-ACP methyl ester carboxylesterase
MTDPTRMVAGAGLGLAAACWGAGRLFHHALLRGLRAPRVPHDPHGPYRPQGPQGPPAGGRRAPIPALKALRLATGQGKQLAAWLAWPVPRPAGPVPAVLVMHGWGANASMMAPVVAPLQAAGMAVLLVDARCHGDSDDERFSSMPRFAEDIATGLRWLRAQPGIDSQRLALLGHSVGAAAALLHVAGLAGQGGDDDVRAVVSLSAFAHPQEVMRRWLAEHRLPYPVLGWAVLRHVQRVIGARFDDIAPLHTLAQLRCPVLLVHGRDDRTVPFDDARRLLQVARHGRLLAVAGDHDLRDALAPHAGEIVAFLQGALAQRWAVRRPPAAGAARSGTSGLAGLPASRLPEPLSIRR